MSPENIAEKHNWSLATMALAAMGALILLSLAAIGTLTSMGYNSLKEQVNQGDTAIHKKIDEGFNANREEMKAMRNDICATNGLVMQMKADITRIDTYQKMRLEKERLQEEMKFKNRK